MEQVAPSGSQLLSRPTARFDYVPPTVRQLPCCLLHIRKRLFSLFITACTCTPLVIIALNLNAHREVLKEHGIGEWLSQAEVARWSIPIVSVGFTWWHVWLGIQMCWYPIEFVGCCRPVLGWQGIVPRRAGVMAERACELMIGNLITIEEIIDRIEPEDFFMKLTPVLSRLTQAVLRRVAMKHFPQVWQMLPDAVKEELRARTYEETQQMFSPVVADIKKNVHSIFNIKQMAVESLTGEPRLLVRMFQEIGRREFKFVMHVAAVMGGILGWIQLGVSFFFAGGPANWYILPISGLCIGYFTNWLAITMIFRPVHPHIMCGGYINVQGVFLKRQAQVATELASMICTHLVYARKMLEFVVRTDGFEHVLGIYQRHMEAAIDGVVGRAKVVLPALVGADAIQGIKDDIIQATTVELPVYAKEIEEYMDRTFALEALLRPRLSGLPPEEFEGMLRPVFQEDEWMVLLLGGVLGVIVGFVQAWLVSMGAAG